MSVLNEKIIFNAKFDNEENTVIAIYLEEPESTPDNLVTSSYYIDATDYEHEDFIALTKTQGWDLDRIKATTLQENQAAYHEFRLAMYNEYQDELERKDAEIKSLVAQKIDNAQSLLNVDLIELLIENNKQDDKLFEFKLSLFDRAEVEKLPKAKKAALRKATSIMEAISIVKDVEWGVQSSSD